MRRRIGSRMYCEGMGWDGMGWDGLVWDGGVGGWICEYEYE